MPSLPLSGYVRVSRVGDRNGDGFISPDVQEQGIRSWSERTGVQVVIEPHELNVSGGTMDRPVFGSIMGKVRAGQSGGIVVYKLDRFARSLLGAISVLETLGKHDAVLASATEPELDYTTPAGRAFLQQMFVFAEFTRSTLKESWATAQRSAIERGIHISPTSYLGYDTGADRRLVPNGQSQIAVEMFQRRASGEAWGSIADWLNRVAPRGGKMWTATSVQRLCAKRIYRGEASRYVDQDVDNRGPIVNRNAHPPLVTEEEWQAAQMNPRLASGGSNGSLPLLASLIRCAGCRYSMSSGRGPKGERIYRCRREHASGKCPHPAQVMADVIEEYVEDAVLAEIDGIAKLVPESAERERITDEVTQARSDLEDFRNDTAARRKLGAEWHDWLDRYLECVRDLETELDQADQRIGVVQQGLTREHYLDLPVSDRREVLGGFLDCLFVRRSRGRGRHVDPIDSRVRILWRGQAPSDLPRRRVVNVLRPYDFEDHVEAGMPAAKDAA